MIRRPSLSLVPRPKPVELASIDLLFYRERGRPQAIVQLTRAIKPCFRTMDATLFDAAQSVRYAGIAAGRAHAELRTRMDASEDTQPIPQMNWGRV